MRCKHLPLFVFLLLFVACNETKSGTEIGSKEQQEANCIKNILEKDSILGTIRNHASENLPLSAAIANYTNELKKLDFNGCPKQFKSAFQKHISAWVDLTNITNKYKSMRGELHDIFDRLEKSADSVDFKFGVKNIWDTWKLVDESKN